ncbi:hypothetical protein C3L33_18182, partial [Rhododendron williamsianum]
MAGSTTTITRQLGPSAFPTTTTTTTTLTLDHSSPFPSSSQPQPREILTMELKKKNKKKKVTWKEGTVDNEFLQKKSSKKCCIFHKDKPFDDDDSDDDDSRRPDEDHGHGHDHGDVGFTWEVLYVACGYGWPLRILYTVANNLGLSAHRAFAFYPSRLGKLDQREEVFGRSQKEVESKHGHLQLRGSSRSSIEEPGVPMPIKSCVLKDAIIYPAVSYGWLKIKCEGWVGVGTKDSVAEDV